MSDKEKMLDEIRGEMMVMNLAQEQMRKLRLPENRSKGSWENDHPLTLFVRLTEEVRELREELHLSFSFSSHSSMLRREDLDKILSECADVANFAAMIADVCSRRLA